MTTVNAEDKHINQILEIQRVCLKERYTPAFVKLILEFNPGLNYVFIKDGKVVGYVLARMEEKRCHIVSLAVLPKHRRQGIALRLMVFCEITAGGKYDTDELYLETRESSEDAIAFYKYLHFKEKARILDYYSDGETGVIMTKRLEG